MGCLRWCFEISSRVSTHPTERLNYSDGVSEKACYGEGYLECNGAGRFFCILFVSGCEKGYSDISIGNQRWYDKYGNVEAADLQSNETKYVFL